MWRRYQKISFSTEVDHLQIYLLDIDVLFDLLFTGGQKIEIFGKDVRRCIKEVQIYWNFSLASYFWQKAQSDMLIK